VTFGSLFAGIGGFDLGFERAGLTCKWQVEIDPFCRRVLAKHWPHVERFEDVHSVGAANLTPVDVICGGFPCQDISVANTSDTGGLGLDGARSGLWREFSRVVGELRPRFVVVENSPALAVRGLDRVLADFADLGMDAGWTVIRASSVGARHRRERMFVCAYTPSDGLQGWDGRAVTHLATTALGQHSNWPVLSAPLGCRGADGIPDRVDRTHALGNAVVPQVAEWIGRRLMATRDLNVLSGDAEGAATDLDAPSVPSERS
jgi:DNA (cytosine-5)-methyltransferase 1